MSEKDKLNDSPTNVNQDKNQGKRNTKKIICISVVSVIAALCLAVGGFYIGRKTSMFSFSELRSVDTYSTIDALDFKDVTYVIGHKNPDTDTVVSAILCSEVYQRAFNENVVPCVSGKINNETKFVLEHFGIDIPQTMTKADGHQFMLVDHSSYSQAIDGIKDSKILAMYDHHGLGDIEEASPAVIKTLPVGCTATIFYNSFIDNEIKIDKVTAGLFVSAILSDTNNLTSSTTTDIDRQVVEKLAPIAHIDNTEAYYMDMKKHGTSYEGMSDKEIVKSDYKEYTMNGKKVGIANLSAWDAETTEKLKAQIKSYLETNYKDLGMDYIIVKIDNIVDNCSEAFAFGENVDEVMIKAFGSSNPIFNPAASRKTDLVPKVTDALK